MWRDDADACSPRRLPPWSWCDPLDPRFHRWPSPVSSRPAISPH